MGSHCLKEHVIQTISNCALASGFYLQSRWLVWFKIALRLNQAAAERHSVQGHAKNKHNHTSSDDKLFCRNKKQKKLPPLLSCTVYFTLIYFTGKGSPKLFSDLKMQSMDICPESSPTISISCCIICFIMSFLT